MSKNDSGNKVYTILAFVFAGEKRAHEVASEVKWDTRAAADEMGMKIISRAVVAVDARGKTHVHETAHGTKGAAIGAVTGGLLSLIGGPAGCAGEGGRGGRLRGHCRGKIRGGRARVGHHVARGAHPPALCERPPLVAGQKCPNGV